MSENILIHYKFFFVNRNAKSCGAVKHCIKTVWEKQHVPEDKDSICQICLDMVKQARDQLESNETMDEIRQVFEGKIFIDKNNA